MKFLFMFCYKLTKKYGEDEMSVYAAQAAFFILLSVFPFLMLLLALIGLVPIVHESDLLTFLIRVMPDNLDALVIYIFDSLSSDSPMALLSASAIAALWSSSKGMLGIERGLNRACGITVQRNYTSRRLLCTLYMFLFMIMCVLSLVLLVFGETIEKKLVVLFSELFPLYFLAAPFRALCALAVLSLFFLSFYVILPYRRQRILDPLPGAVFSAVGWTLFSFAFSIYFRYFGSYALTYGSLTAVILMMLWLYFCICILFLGAEFNEILQEHKHGSTEEV